MTINLALEYIPRRMQELGYKGNYYIRFRHLVLQANEEQTIDAYNQFYYLVEEAQNVRVESETGIFDLSENTTNEMQYEHQSKIQIKNYSSGINHLRFIQVIPKHKTTIKNKK
ncbi:MAG: hypothetical protein Q7W45_16600 [Bacteroidota bacterium]|nr:hypothetical protein [Bacteroidota bacterium]MDP3145363.1 hypothetical protein [Bacteroidota bacterium]